MRKTGSKTCAKCWKLEVMNQNAPLFTGEYSTLKEISNELGMTYNQIVELSSGRKKQPNGRYDTSYKFTKLKKGDKLNDDEEIIQEEENPSEDEPES